MVGKTYLRYTGGPQGGAVVSSASLALQSGVIRPTYEQDHPFDDSAHTGSASRGNRWKKFSPRSSGAVGVLFVPSLEAVRIYSIRSGEQLYSLVPAQAKMPVEVTTIRVVPLGSVTQNGYNGSRRISDRMSNEGWMLLAGYQNGSVAVFTCGPTCPYGKPICRFYAQGHKVNTSVLALAVDPSQSWMCSGGQDTDITIWDWMSREASFRLRGHRGGIVALEFISKRNDSSTSKHTNLEQVAKAAYGTTHGFSEGDAVDIFIVSAASDGLVKVWNLQARQCIHTVIVNDAQVTSMMIDVSASRMYCGIRESCIKVFNIENMNSSATMSNDLWSKADINESATNTSVLITDHGSIARKFHKPLTSITFSEDGRFILACTSKTIEIFRVLTAQDIRKKVSRKKKRRREGTETEATGKEADEAIDSKEKAGKEVESTLEIMVNQEKDRSLQPTAADEVILMRTFFMQTKIRSACFIPSSQASLSMDEDILSIAVTYNNNNIETFETKLTTSSAEGGATLSLEDLKLKYSFEHRSHQSDVRSLIFVDGDTSLLSLSKEKVMIWALSIKDETVDMEYTDNTDFLDACEANLSRGDFKGTLHPTGELGVEDGVCMAAIGSNLCCIGQEDGSILLADVGASLLLFKESGIHIGGVKHVTTRPNDTGFLSIGADRRLLLWTVSLIAPKGKTKEHSGGVDTDKKEFTVTLVQNQELELTEYPLFASFSPDNRFLGVALQNNNIQLFFADTLKPYLSLFGHKLPVTSLSFSTDGTLVASVGMDKSIRFWGTDFGDCHKAIHAHDDYITSVSFVQDTHYIFTVSLDGTMKYWDGDNWTMIQLFRPNQRGLRSVSITANGTCVAAAGADKCIRCFLRTQDIIFPQEEEEKMAQEAIDEEVANRQAMQKIENNNNTEVAVAGQPTVATAEAAEKLMEALDLVSVELQRKDNPEDTGVRHPFLVPYASEWEYLWSVIESIRPSEIRRTIASMTSTHIDALLNFMEKMLEKGAVLSYEVAAKIVMAAVMPLNRPKGGGVFTSAIKSELSEWEGARRMTILRRRIAKGLNQAVDRMDYNVAALQVANRHIESSRKVKFFDLSKIQGYKKKYQTRAILPEE